MTPPAPKLALSNQPTLLDSSTKRLAGWVVVSIAVHACITWGTGLTASNYRRPSPLQVELRTMIDETHKPLADPGTVPQIDSPTKVPNSAESTTTPPNARQPVDVTRAINLPLEVYYASSEVDTRAEPLNEVNLIYPLMPYQQRLKGTVRLNIFVNELGGIDKVAITESNPAGVFEEAALQAVNELKFSPAIKNGLRVKNRKTIEVVFDPYEKINTP